MTTSATQSSRLRSFGSAFAALLLFVTACSASPVLEASTSQAETSSAETQAVLADAPNEAVDVAADEPVTAVEAQPEPIDRELVCSSVDIGVIERWLGPVESMGPHKQQGCFWNAAHSSAGTVPLQAVTMRVELGEGATPSTVLSAAAPFPELAPGAMRSDGFSALEHNGRLYSFWIRPDGAEYGAPIGTPDNPVDLYREVVFDLIAAFEANA